MSEEGNADLFRVATLACSQRSGMFFDWMQAKLSTLLVAVGALVVGLGLVAPVVEPLEVAYAVVVAGCDVITLAA